MAYIHMNYFSRTLLRNVDVSVIIPTETCQDIRNDFDSNFREEYPVMYLFHGAFGDYTDWLRYTDIESYALRYGLAIVMPSVENTFALNIENGDAYLSFAGKELPAIIEHLFPVSSSRDQVFAGGLSMGGYVACSVAAHYPKKFSRAVTLSGALDIEDVLRMSEQGDERLPFHFRQLLGSNYTTPGIYSLPDLFRKNREEGIDTAVFQACGTEDFLYDVNQKVRKDLEAVLDQYMYQEGPGAHEWLFWNNYIEAGIAWCLQEKAAAAT